MKRVRYEVIETATTEHMASVLNRFKAGTSTPVGYVLQRVTVRIAKDEDGKASESFLREVEAFFADKKLADIVSALLNIEEHRKAAAAHPPGTKLPEGWGEV